ncbi:MAG: RNA ligase family protein [Bacteroidota bacterium]
MSNYSGYEKMAGSLKKLSSGRVALNDQDISQLDKLKWVVTEKIHGANFSFSYDNNTLRYGKRKEYLSWADDFFGFQLVVSQIEDQVTRLFEALSRNVKADKYIIYGELFGGRYPHQDVAAVEDVQAIQTGVYYAPGIHFCAFDIAIEDSASGRKDYLGYETAINYFEQYEVQYARPLLIGKLNEATNFNPRINSAIPESLGLPPLADNLIEGVVIKPYNQPLGNQMTARPIFKVKNAEFEEEKRFHEAQKWSFIPNVSSKTEELSFIFDELKNYVNYNRLESAVSKIGALQFENQDRVRELTEEVLRDTIADFNENNDNLLKELSEDDRDWLKERTLSVIRKLIDDSRNR